MCVTSISIGFHLNGISSARRNAYEMESILAEQPTIETEFSRKRRQAAVVCVAPKGVWDGKESGGEFLPPYSTHLPTFVHMRFQRHNFSLFKRSAKIAAQSGAPKLKGDGAITFENVHFSYPSRPDVEVNEEADKEKKISAFFDLRLRRSAGLDGHHIISPHVNLPQTALYKTMKKLMNFKEISIINGLLITTPIEY